jgi:hypothetical protein
MTGTGSPETATRRLRSRVIPAVLAVVVLSGATPGQTSPLAPRGGIAQLEANALCREFEAAFATKDPKRYEALLATDFDADLGSVDRTKAVEKFKAILDAHKDLHVSLKPIAFDPDPPAAALTVSVEYAMHGHDQELPPAATYVWVLGREDGRVKVRSEIEVDEGSPARSHDASYDSPKAGFHVERPVDWLFLDPKKKGLTSDLVFLLRPSTDSFVCIAGLDLPREMDARDIQTGDDALLESLCANDFRLLDSGPIEIGGAKGYQSTVRCTLEGKALQRWRVTLVQGRAMYAVECHSTPPEAFERDRETFERVVNTFRITGACGRGAGAVDGRIFRSSEVGCQFAAPAGWTIEPARSDLAFQAYANPPEGKSFVIAGAENVHYTMDSEQLAAVLEEVEKSLKRVDPKLSRVREVRDVKVDGQPAKEVVWDLQLPGNLARRRKAVYFSIGDHLCFLHCDAIPPSDFDRMEPAFDRIVESFSRSRQ